MSRYIAALDQGTTSTRCIIFDSTGSMVSSHQLEHRQIFPQPGWVEHDPVEIWQRSREVIRGALEKAGIAGKQVAALGITNQRETTVVWNPKTGEPFGNAIVWQDMRTSARVEKLIAEGGKDRLRARTGLPLAAYFSGTKLEWILNNRPGVREAAGRGEAVFGTIDTYVTWWLSGGPDGGVHVTDPTNASRTLLMNIANLEWDSELLKLFSVPGSMLPEIRASVPSEPYGFTSASGPFAAEVPIAGILGDQQAALFGQACFESGESKNTYGTGCFLLMNTGENLVQSSHGLITTVAYQAGKDRPRYALEGSVAIAGSLVQWMRDNLGLIRNSSEIEELANSVDDSGDVYFVPAFSGLYAPHWRSDARGIIAGLTGYATAGHLARAVLEATAFQTREIVDAMLSDSGLEIRDLRVDGGMVVNETLMQFQSDILDMPVIRPEFTETTALGAAYAAGLATGFWGNQAELKSHWKEDYRWTPRMSAEDRSHRLKYWSKALERSKGWAEQDG
jgi:glycerol kinase